MKSLTPKERLGIYKKAEKMFKNDYMGGFSHKYCGMCYPIERSLNHLGFSSYLFKPLNAPEMKKFEPKRKWGEQPAFWWSPNDHRALKRRLKILKHLASGEWMGL